MNPSHFLRYPLGVVFVAFAGLASARADTFDCIMEPTQQVKIGSAVTGVLQSVLVERGSAVKAGEELAKLDATVERANLAIAEAQAQSTEGIEAQRTRMQLAKKKLDRAAPLAQKDIVSRDKLEGFEADYEISKRDLNTEMIKQKMADLETQRARAALDLRTIKSPIAGLVTDKHLSAGEFVNQEAYVMTLVQLDPLYVEAYIPVAYYGKIRSGLNGTVRPAEPIGGSYPAVITVTDHVFDAASGTYGVRLELKNPDNTLPGGQRCRVEFDVAIPQGAGAQATDQKTSGDRLNQELRTSQDSGATSKR